MPSDRGPLKACAEAGKRGSALLHAWRFEQNHVPPSCGRSFRPTVYGRSHGTRRHGVWAQACCRRRRARGAARRRRGHAATPPCCRVAAVVSCQKPTATATGLGGTAFSVHGLLPPPSQGCCLRRRRHGVWGPRLAAAAAAAGVLPAAAAAAHVATPRVSLPPIHRTPSCASLCLGRGCSLLIAHCSSHTAQRSLPYIPPSRRTLLPPAPRPIWPLARPIPPRWGPPTPGPPPSRPLLSQRPRAGAALIAYIVRLSLLF